MRNWVVQQYIWRYRRVVVITEEYNVMINSEELSGVQQYIWRYRRGVVISEEYNVMINSAELSGIAVYLTS